MRAVVLAATAAASDAVRVSTGLVNAYEAFRRDHGIERALGDEVDYATRASLFERRREEVRKHNAKPGMGWVAGVNKFADFTEEEFKALLGHRPGKRVQKPAQASLVSSLLQSMPAHEHLAATVDWSAQINNDVLGPKDQGACGSCWALATAGAVETSLAAAGLKNADGSPITVSYEQLVDCVKNEDQCGGTGGCSGATAELAFQHIHDSGGIATASAYSEVGGYQHDGDGTCKSVLPAVKVGGFVQVAQNSATALMQAVSKGAVAVSSDASPWMNYESGVFHGCSPDATINHAILLMGYGTDAKSGMPYWRIRNSWGNTWGEAGFIRLQRHTGEDQNCGTDYAPLEGVGCAAGDNIAPATMKVCGMCGVLADSAYPTGVELA